MSIRYRAQCAFCSSGCVVSQAKDAKSFQHHHERATDHVVTIAEVR